MRTWYFYLYTHKQKIAIAGIVCLLILFLSEVVVSFLYREMWIDEVFSSFRSYTVLTGELVPFKNGVFYYPPLVVPTYGLLHYLFGPSLHLGRGLSILFFTLALFILYRIAARRAGRGAGSAVVLLLLSNLLLVSNYVSATMYALTAFLFSCLLAVESRVELPVGRQVAAPAFLVGLLILTRTNMVAVAAAYFLYLLIRKVPLKSLLLFVLVTAVVVALGYLPVVLPNPSLALSYLASSFANIGPLEELPSSGVVGSVTFFKVLSVLTELVREYFGFLFLFVLAAGYVFGNRARVKVVAREEPFLLFLGLTTVVLLLSHYFYWRAVGSVYYFNYIAPVLVLFAVLVGARLFSNRRLAAFLLSAVVVLNLMGNLSRADLFSDPRQESDLARLERGAAIIETHIPRGAKVLAFDNSIAHLFLADRRTYPPLVNRDFLFLGDADTEKVRRLGFYNVAMLREWAEDDAEFVVLHKELWGLPFVRLPFWGKGTEDVEARVKELEHIFDTEFELIAEADIVYPRKYLGGNDAATLQIFKRR